MSSNSETFNLPSGNKLNWERATLERCNLVYTNGADAGAQYVVQIDQMPQEQMVCDSGAVTNKMGTFLVGAEPFNPHESLTVRNTNPERALDHLTISIRTLTGALATISNAFYISLKIKERQV